MKMKILGIIALLQMSLATYAQESQTTDTLLFHPADVGLVYPISTNGRKASMYRNAVSFQALVGLSGSISGAAFAGIGNIVKGNSRGAAFAGLYNLTGNVKGAQFAGLYNSVNQNMTGAQFAGIGNSIGDGSKAVQVAGIFNRAETVHSQMAGLVNIAHKVEGVQLSGLINIADSSDYPIGFINLIKNGEKSIGLSVDGNFNTMLSFYSGSKKMYGIMGVGYNFREKLYGLQCGIGAHLFNTGKRFGLNTETLQLVQTDFKNGHCYTFTLQALPEVAIADKFKLFSGPSANLQLDYSDGKISGLTSRHFWTTTGKSNHFIGAYAGITGGIKYTL